MIHPSRVLAILRKDLVDATRQGRIVVILLTPLLLAVFYNFSFSDERRPELKAAYVSADGAEIMDKLRTRVSSVIDLKVSVVPDEAAARAAIADRKADIAFLLPAGLEASIRDGRTPAITVIAESSSTGRELVSSALLAVFREIAGQGPPAILRSETVERAGSDPLLITRLGPRVYFVLASLIMLIGMVSMIIVPMVLAEESEKRTLDALLMAGSYIDVMVAKALVGAVFTGLSIAVVVVLTRLQIRDVSMFVLGLGALALGLVGLGLFLGGLFKTAQQVSTWSSFFLLPVIGPAFAVGVPVPAPVETALRVLPSSQAVRIVANAFGEAPIFADTLVSAAVVVAWAAAAYALLGWQLARRES